MFWGANSGSWCGRCSNVSEGQTWTLPFFRTFQLEVWKGADLPKLSCEVLKLFFALSTAVLGCPPLSRDRISAAYRFDPGRARSDPGRARARSRTFAGPRNNRPDLAGMIENRFRSEKHPARSEKKNPNGQPPVWDYVPLAISQFPNFPNRAGPYGLFFWGKLGNWEVCTSSHMGGFFLGNWEIGKYGALTIPNFPISQNVLGHMGSGHLGNQEFGRWIGRDLFIHRGCVYKRAPIYFPM